MNKSVKMGKSEQKQAKAQGDVTVIFNHYKYA